MKDKTNQKEQRNIDDQIDVVVVGGGIGGSTLAATLSNAGISVLVLERETEFVDRVRGEWIAPWGVVEAKTLGLYDHLMNAGGHHITRHIGYDETLTPTQAEAGELPLGIIEGIPGPLTIEHVKLQNIAVKIAVQAGATTLRGVKNIKVVKGTQPSVSYEHESTVQTIHCRLIVGADGRSSTVRRQVGLKLVEDPIDHLMSGLLIENASGWPEDLQAMGKVGDIAYLVFPQGQGKIRLYADYDIEGRSRFSGASAAADMLAAFRMSAVPNSEVIADARPIGPCRSNPSQDAWVDDPFDDGVVLIGDAGGYNDPILGQGLSITLQDVRLVTDILMSESSWTKEIFESYGVKRKERMRRLRISAQMVTQMFARFGPEAEARRKRAQARMLQKPELRMAMLAAYLGTETIDASFFEPEIQAELFE